MIVVVSFSALFKTHLAKRINESNRLSCIEKILSRDETKYGSDSQFLSKCTSEDFPAIVYNHRTGSNHMIDSKKSYESVFQEQCPSHHHILRQLQVSLFSAAACFYTWYSHLSN